MQLIQLQYFCTVARCRNMSRAAEELWISQPALSKAISNLEEELGIRLFDRIGRGIRLNDAGRLFYHQISHIMLLLDDAVRQAQRVKSAQHHDVSVLFTAATFVAPRIREEFERESPEISLEIKCCYTPDPQDLRDCDFHIYATPMESPGMVPVKMLEEPMLLTCNSKHDLAGRGEVDLVETREYMYQCLPPHENMHENFASSCKKAGFEPKIAFCTEDSYAFFSGLGSSNLLTMVPAYTAFSSLCNNLVLLKIRNPKCTRTVYMASHQGRELSENCLTFQSFCFNFFKRLASGYTKEN